MERHVAPPDIVRPARVGMPTFSAGHLGALLGRAITIAGLAALIAGLTVGGIGSRLAMRLVMVLGDPADIGRLTEAQARVGDISFDALQETRWWLDISRWAVWARASLDRHR